MNSKQMYVPNHEKWNQFYKNAGISEHPTNINLKQTNKNTYSGGSIGKLSTNSIVPIETKLSSRDNSNASIKAVKLNLVSPAQQTVEQAEKELERSSDQGLKRKITSSTSQKKTNGGKRQRKVKKASNGIKDVGNQF